MDSNSTPVIIFDSCLRTCRFLIENDQVRLARRSACEWNVDFWLHERLISMPYGSTDRSSSMIIISMADTSRATMSMTMHTFSFRRSPTLFSPPLINIPFSHIFPNRIETCKTLSSASTCFWIGNLFVFSSNDERNDRCHWDQRSTHLINVERRRRKTDPMSEWMTIIIH